MSLKHLVLRVDGNPLRPCEYREWIPTVLSRWPPPALLPSVTLGLSECGLSSSERGSIADWRFALGHHAITLHL